MDDINSSRFKKNTDVIKSHFKNIGDSIVTTSDIRVVFPERYINKSLAVIENDVRVVSIYAIIDEDNNYSIVNKPIYINLKPNIIKNIVIDGVIYKQLTFNKNSVYCENRNLVKIDNFFYSIFDEFFIQGKIPWYIGYGDLASIFSEAKYYADSKIGDNIITLEILAMMVSRDPNNKKEYFRNSIKTEKDKYIKPTYVGLYNMFNTFDNTVSKLVGSYFNNGITAALAEEETEPTVIEEILRA